MRYRDKILQTYRETTQTEDKKSETQKIFPEGRKWGRNLLFSVFKEN
jgi:hypothetical protein